MLQWLHYFHCWVFQDEKKILIAISSATIQHFVFREGKKTRCWRIFHRDYYFRLHLLDTTIFFTLVTMWIFSLVMVVSIAMHMYLSATLLRYLETWILHQKHFKMNCFIETGLKSCSILRKCFVIQEILNSHNTMPGCIGWFCRQSKIDPKYCSR